LRKYLRNNGLFFQLAASFLLFFQQSFGVSSWESGLRKCVLSNGVDVILHENFRMPVVVVGIIFHVGYFHAPISKQGVNDLVAANLIDQKSRMKLSDVGVLYEINSYGAHTEILAMMAPKHLKRFFQIISESSFSVKNLETLKKQMCVNNKLARYCFEDAVHNEIFSNIKYKNSNFGGAVFNEQALSAVSSADVKDFFEEHYKKCHLSVVICGAVGHKNLIKILQSTVCNLPPRRKVSHDRCLDRIPKNITIESKYAGRSVRYFYKISKEDVPLFEAFSKILNYELFRFFEKTNKIIFDYKNHNIATNGDCICGIVFYPKSDVSLSDFQRAYEIFVHRLCGQEFSEDDLEKARRYADYSRQFLLGDLYDVYRRVKNDYLNGLNSETEIHNSKQFNSFAEKLFRQNLTLQIITRYRPDK
jgi:predicted Zn-dependent peptidase